MTLAVVLLLWAGRAEVVLAGDDVLLADWAYGLDAGFDSAEASGVGVASAFVSLRVGGWGGFGTTI